MISEGDNDKCYEDYYTVYCIMYKFWQTSVGYCAQLFSLADFQYWFLTSVMSWQLLKGKHYIYTVVFFLLRNALYARMHINTCSAVGCTPVCVFSYIGGLSEPDELAQTKAALKQFYCAW